MKLLTRIKKQVALVCALTMLLGTQVTTFANDYTGHWAHDIIEQWSDNGIISGYEDGTFRPNNNITRAEFAGVLSQVFGLKDTTSKILFSDVKIGAWYEAGINKVVTAGIMQGVSSSQFNPSAPITRQEAAVALVNAYFITEEGSRTISFKDKSSIASWAQEQVELLASNGYIGGRPDGNFDPRANITRAEVLSILNNLTSNLITKAGTYTTIKAGNVVVNTAGVTLKNITIDGDLYLTQGINHGQITLDNVTVTGNIYVVANNADSINFNNSNVEGIVELLTLDETHLKSENSKLNVHITNENQTVVLEGTFNEVIAAQGSNSSLVDATINKMTLLNDGNDASTQLTLDHDSVIKELICNAPADITGKGTIEILNANSKDISCTIKPNKLIGTINGEDEKEDTPVKDEDKDNSDSDSDSEDDTDEDEDDNYVPAPQVNPYIEFSSITVEGQDFLNKGISVDKAIINVDVNELKAAVSSSATISTAVANIKHLEDGTTIKASLPVLPGRPLDTTIQNGAVTVTASNLTGILAENKGTILGLLNDRNMIAHAQGVAELLGTNLDNLFAKRESVNTKNVIKAYEILLANKDHEDVKPFINYLNRAGITLTESKLSFTVNISAEGLVTRDYTVNINF